MKQKLICSLLVTVCLVGTSLAQSLIRPKTADDNLGTSTYPFGTVYAGGIATTSKVYTITSGTVYVPSNLVVTGTAVVTGAVTAASSITAATTIGATAGAISSWTYTTVVGTNKTTQVYMIQSKAITGADISTATTVTNTFSPEFIATPTVIISYDAAGATNIAKTALASNAMELVWQTNYTYHAYGRIK